MSVKSIPVVATVSPLAGKTAVELRALLSAKATTKKALIAFLSAKESLRAPSAKLLAELTGAAPAAKVAKAVAPVKPAKEVGVPAPKAAPSMVGETISALLKRVSALEAALAKLAPVVVVAPVVAPVAAKPAKAAKAVALAELLADEGEDDTVTEADLRTQLAEQTLTELRAQAVTLEIPGAAKMGKKALIEALVEDYVLAGVVLAAEPVVAAKAARKVAADEVNF